ncbi:glycerophosphodiester phosphodiesterase [Legionella yabuuchiae]|uniref:glycerophosphodiester phosphodiesterase n=1 Tax=Legionella yabuuchiae TaxID=376727 RepID=UPI001054CAEC|nr:glycerophosphodiester phosphodiesterase [Legionella yabuuchiae]
MLLDFEPIIAHRGASAYAPENTMAAFKKALALGCHFIEFDVMLSEDGEPFVFHDDSLKRTTNGRGPFAKKSAKELLELDAGGWFSKRFRGESIPTLSDVLQWMISSKVHANIEIKPTAGKLEETTVAVLTSLNRHWPSSKPLPLLSSFEPDVLKLCRDLSPEAPLGLLLHTWDENWYKLADELQCVSIHLSVKAANKVRIAAIKDKGYKVLIYTVNRRRLAHKLFEWGVNAIFSDYPDLLA